MSYPADDQGVRCPSMGVNRDGSGRLGGLVRRLPRSRLISKFALIGVVVGLTHLGLVTTMVVVGVPIQGALALAYIVALCLHFTLNRQWVFVAENGYAFRLSMQGLRYLFTAASCYAVTAVAVALFPSVVGLPELVVFFLASGGIACVSFVVLHLWVFRAAPRETT